MFLFLEEQSNVFMISLNVYSLDENGAGSQHCKWLKLVGQRRLTMNSGYCTPYDVKYHASHDFLKLKILIGENLKVTLRSGATSGN